MPRNNVPLRDRFRAAVALAGHNVASWAREKGHRDADVWNNLSGFRNMPAIRADIAALLNMSVKRLDAEIAALVAQRKSPANDDEAA